MAIGNIVPNILHREEGIYLSPFLTVLQPGTTHRSNVGRERKARGLSDFLADIGHVDDRSAFGLISIIWSYFHFQCALISFSRWWARMSIDNESNQVT